MCFNCGDHTRRDGSSFVPIKPDDTIEIDLDLTSWMPPVPRVESNLSEIKDYAERIWLEGFKFIYFSGKNANGIEVGENYNLPKSEKCKSSTMPEREGRSYQGCPEIFCDDLRNR